MKITASRLLDTAKILQTDAGQKLSELVDYVTSTSEELIRALRGSLTFSDNFNSMVWTGTLTHATAQLINTGQRQPTAIIYGQVQSTAYGFASLTWYMDSNTNLVVKPYFGPSVPTQALGATLTILF